MWGQADLGRNNSYLGIELSLHPLDGGSYDTHREWTGVHSYTKIQRGTSLKHVYIKAVTWQNMKSYTVIINGIFKI